MRLSNWVGNNLQMLDCDVDEVYNDGTFVGIRFTKDDYVPTVRPDNITPPSQCTETRCEGGKYKKYDGSYGICYRCDGLGYITPDKAIKNKQHDSYKNKERIHA